MAQPDCSITSPAALKPFLTASEPIRATFHTHANARDSLFDMHYELELGVVLSGVMERIFEKTAVVLTPGQVWLHSMWEPHGFCLRSAPCEVLIMTCLPDLLLEGNPPNFPALDWMALFRLRPAERPQPTHSELSEVLRIAGRVRAHCAAPESLKYHWLRTHIMELLLLLQPNVKTPVRPGSGASLQGIHASIYRVFESCRFVTLAEAAALCHMSESAFARHFKTLMGISFTEFGLRHRLKGAARELLSSKLSAEVIAAHWGFTDLSHLYRAFGRQYGCTPREYRQRGLTIPE